jgi:hypothetical protein
MVSTSLVTIHIFIAKAFFAMREEITLYESPNIVFQVNYVFTDVARWIIWVLSIDTMQLSLNEGVKGVGNP